MLLRRPQLELPLLGLQHAGGQHDACAAGEDPLPVGFELIEGGEDLLTNLRGLLLLRCQVLLACEDGAAQTAAGGLIAEGHLDL